MPWIGLALAGLLACAGCGLENCTTLGCGAPVRLELPLEAVVPASATVTVRFSGLTADCDIAPPISSCSDQRVFAALGGGALTVEVRDGKPDCILVTLESGTLSRKWARRLTYGTATPNGPTCDPVCAVTLSAAVTDACQ